MRQSYFKNAALLTGSDVVLRLAGMGLRIWLANALGGAGMGLYQLVLAVYGLFVTLATAGISVAAARLLTEELSRDKAAARGMLVRLVLAGLTLGGLAMVAQLATAGLAAKWWLGDVRAAAALRTSALGLPWMAVSAVLRGFFLARRRVEPNVLRSGIAGRTGCTAIRAVMGTFFAHSLCRARQGQDPGGALPPCSKYRRGLTPCLTTVNYTIKSAQKQPIAPLMFCKAAA